MSSNSGTGHDIIVVGGSAGGVEALEQLVRALPPRLGASVLIVLHRPPDYESLLPQILSRAGQMPAAEARDGERPRPGHVYVAPPDRHLIVEDGAMRLVRGPKENHARPAVDPLFRSAAQDFGPRVVGVILSGTLYDGTAGLFAVKRRGGVTVVQDPTEAAFPGMPESAIGNVAVDHVLPVAEMGTLLRRLAGRSRDTDNENEGTTAMSPAEPHSSEPLEFEQLPEVVTENQGEQVRGARNGQPSLFTCPDCGGTLWQANAGPSLVQFRCHVGHAYTGEALAREQTDVLEKSLWYAIRLLVDKSLLLRELAGNARRRGDADVARQLEDRSREADIHGQTLRQVLQTEK